MTNDTRATQTAKLAEKVILGIIAGGAAAIGVIEVVMLVGRVIRTAVDDAVTLTGLPLVEAIAEQYTSASPLVTSAWYETVGLTIEGLPASARAALIGATILTSLVSIGICAAVAWLCVRVFVGRPFVRSATWGIGVVAILVIAGGLGGSLLNGIANAEAVAHAGLADAGLPIFLVTTDLAPLGWGLALAVVAGAFELGQRMQRDQEGLV